MGKSRASALVLLLILNLFATVAARAGESFYSRRVELTGWSPSGDRLLYQEETTADDQITLRAVVIDAARNKLAREFPLQAKDDAPEAVAEHQRALASYIEKEEFTPPRAAIAYANPKREGFLSPDGIWLVQPGLQLKPRDAKKTLQRLTISFRAVELTTGQERPLAELEMDSIDGEHPLNLDSPGNLTVSEMVWGKAGGFAAVVVQEARPRFRVQGVFALQLQFPEPTSPVAQDSLKMVATNGKKAVTNASDTDSLRKHHTVRDGEAMALDWKLGVTAATADGRYIAAPNAYTACIDDKPKTFSSQITVFDRETQTFEEFPLAASLSGGDLGVQAQAGQFEVRYLGETLRTIAPKSTPAKLNQKTAFAVQVASLLEENAAKAHVKRLCAKGLPAYYVAVTSGDQPRYRVRLGRFASQTQARRFAKAHLKGNKAIVTPF